MAAPTNETALLASLLSAYRGRLAAAVLIASAESLVALSLPWFAGRVAEALMQARAADLLLLGWAAVLGAQAVLAIANARVLGTLSARLGADLGMRVHDHLQALPLRWHHERKRGEVLALLGQDVWQVAGFASSTLPAVLPALLTAAGALGMLLWIEPRAGIAVAVAVPVYVLALKLAGRRLRPLAAAYYSAYAERFGLAERHLAILPLTKAYTREPDTAAAFRASSDAAFAAEVRHLALEATLSPLVRWTAATAVLVLLAVGGHRIAAGAMDAPALVSLLLYGLLLAQPVSNLAGVYGRLQATRAAARRLLEALSTSPEPDDGQRPVTLARGEIVFDTVSFAYPGRPPVLRGLDLTIRAGETVAITGPNGSGKSTLAHLLMRFADPDGGRITLDGTDLRELRLADLRRQIGLVSQQVLVLNDTVAANIGFGRPDADRAAIESAARAAHAHEFVARLPHGYDTVVGDEGVRLSGGQRQRIALARALLKDPAILVLDEATAMFDPEGERDFIAEGRALLRQRTVLMITHRPASLALADRVVRVEEGRIVPAPASRAV